MALDQLVRNGVVFITGTAADIETARASSLLVVGRLYSDTTGNRQGRAVSNGNVVDATKTDVILWETTMTQVAAAILVETNRATAAEGVIATGLAAEITRATGVEAGLSTDINNAIAYALSEHNTRVSEDIRIEGLITSEASARAAAVTAIQSGLASEITRATTREDAIEADYIAANTAQTTTLLAAFQSAMDIYADKDVREIKTVSFVDADTFSMATLLGANPVDGVHAVRFVGSAITDSATVTALGMSDAGTGNITFGDILLVKVDGGAIVSTEKSDDITKQIWAALTSDVAALQAATTPSAIRSHFSATGWATYANGVFNVAPSTGSGNDLTTSILDGKAYLNVNSTAVQYLDDTNTQKDVAVGASFTAVYSKLANISSNLLTAENGTQVLAGKVELGGALTKNTAITGAFDLDLAAVNVVKVPYLVYECYTATRNAEGYVTGMGAKTTGKVHVWFDEQGDPVNLFVPN